jgi:hypothetical protein
MDEPTMNVSRLPSAKQSISRDRWGRPLVIPPDGGKPVAYRRVTTIAKAIDDTSNIQRWAQRMTAFGLAKRPDLFALVARCELDDKKELDRLCDQAKEHAGGSAAANTGTAIHALLEQFDNGQDPTPVNPNEELALTAWQRFLASTGWTIDGVEVFVVQDDIQAAGTLDRILSGHIADLKTGASANYGHQAWAAQLSIYAHSKRYVDGVRSPLDVDRKTGYILHLPVGARDVTVYDIDLERGRQIAKVAMSVIEWRATKDLMRRHDPWSVPRPKP